MTLRELGISSHENAVNKGFYEEIHNLLEHPYLNDREKKFILFLWRSNRLMLIVSELAEGLEGLRKDNLSVLPKSGGLGEELADAQIRLADLAMDLNLDLESAVKIKADYNSTRPHKHGGVA